MGAVYRREIKAYFYTPLGCMFICIVYFFTGYYFFSNNIVGNTTDTYAIFSTLYYVVLFLIPVLAMRLISEERHKKTEQILFASPVSRFGIVCGKYLAVLSVYTLAISVTWIMALVMQIYSQPNWPVVLGNILGLFLLGAVLIAVCLFISSLAKNQIFAAVGGFAASLFMILIDFTFYIAANGTLRTFANHISFNSRYRGFTIGVIALEDCFFFISIAALFICLTAVVLERRKWRD